MTFAHQQPPHENELILEPLPLGIGKTRTLLTSLSMLVGRPPRTVLVVSPIQLRTQWEHMIHQQLPNARVLALWAGATFVETMAPLDTRGLIVKVADLEATPREVWERQHPEPCFFLTSFYQVRKRLPQSLEKWFEFSIEDEGYPTAQTAANRKHISMLSRSFLRFADPGFKSMPTPEAIVNAYWRNIPGFKEWCEKMAAQAPARPWTIPIEVADPDPWPALQAISTTQSAGEVK